MTKALMTNSGGGQRPMTEADIFAPLLAGQGFGRSKGGGAQPQQPAPAPPLPTQPMNYTGNLAGVQGAPQAAGAKGGARPAGKFATRPMPGADPRGNG